MKTHRASAFRLFQPSAFRLSGFFLAAFSLLAFSPSLRAQYTTWSGGTGAWNDNTMWDTGVVPVASTTTILNDGLIHVAYGVAASATRLMVGDDVTSSGTVIVDGNLSLGTISYIGGNGDGYVHITTSGSVILGSSWRVGGYIAADAPHGDHVVGTGNGYTLVEGFLGHATANRTIAAGYDGSGRIDVAGSGTVMSGDFYIGDQATSSGTVNVWGNWTAAGTIIRVGSGGAMGIGSNVLNIYEDGSFIGTNTGTTKIIVANAANTSGIINIEQGGSMTTTGFEFRIDQGATSYGEVNVDGLLDFSAGSGIGTLNAIFYIGAGANSTGILNTGSTGVVNVNCANFYIGVGNGATGILNIDNHGVVNANCSNFYVGVGNGATGILNTGSNSIVDVNCAVFSIGNALGSYGEVNVGGLLTINAGDFRIGDAGSTTAGVGPIGVLRIADTGTVTFTGTETAIGRLGYGSGATYLSNASGTAFVDGVWTNAGWLLVGRSGDGYLHIGETGTVTVGTYIGVGRYRGALPASGTIVVEGYLGAGSYVDIGWVGDGHLEVAESGTMIAGTSINFGVDATAVGTGTVAGFMKATGNLFVGIRGTGALHIGETGRLESGQAWIGAGLDSSGTVFVDGLWVASNYIHVGGSATGTSGASGYLHIGESGTVISTGGRVAYGHRDTNATVIVEGVWDSSNYIQIGQWGDATLTVGPTGLVKSDDYIFIGGGDDPVKTGTGSAYVSGTMQAATNFRVGNSNNGYLYVSDTGRVTAMGIGIIGNAATSTGTAFVDGYLGIGDYFYVGAAGQGYLHIGQTGTVITGLINPTYNGYVHIGRTGGNGTVVVDGYFGIGQTTGGSFQVGYNGIGVLDITPTGTTRAGTYISIGGNNFGHGTINVAGLLIAPNSSGHLYLGRNPTTSVTNNSTGILNIFSTGTAIFGGNLIAAAIETGTLTTAAGVFSTGTATVAGLLSVTGNLILGQRGDAYLNIQPGGTVIVGGITTIGATATTGTGVLLLNGGILEPRQLVRGPGVSTILYNGGTIRASSSTDTLFVNFTTIDIGAGALGIDTQNFTVTATNALAGTAAAIFNKTGAGVLVLNADNSGYAGATNVLAGSLDFGPGVSLGGTVTAGSGGSVRPSTAGAAVNNLVINDGGTLDLRLAPLTAASVTFDNDARWRYSMTSAHALESLGPLTIGGAGNFIIALGDYSIADILGSHTVGSYATISGGANLASWAVTGPGLELVASLNASATPGPGVVTLNVTAGDMVILHWQGGVGTWDSTATTWLRDGVPPLVDWFPGAYGVFDTGAGTVDVVGAQEVTGLEFSANGYTLAGTGTLTSDETLSINTYTTSATATINTTITAGNLSKTSAGTLILGGTATFTGSAIVHNGAIEIASTGVLTAASGHVATSEGSSARLDVAGRFETNGNFYVGDGGDGTVYVGSSGSVRVGATSYIGCQQGSTSVVTIDGGVWDNIGNFAVGYVTGAIGSVTIENGGTLHTRGASGAYIGNQAGAQGGMIVKNGGYWNAPTTVYLGGAGTGLLTIGSGGTARFGTVSYIGASDTAFGSLTIEDGGYLSTGGRIYISDAGGTGVLNIDTNGYLRGSTGIMVGYGGYGELNLATGGTLILDGQTLYIGGDAGVNTSAHGVANINGFFQSASGTYYFPVGYSGTGVLNIGPTGTVFAANLEVGREATATGTAIISGYYLCSVGNTGIGTSGKGTLVIEQDGVYISDTPNNYVIFGYNAGANGTGIIRGLLDSGTRGSLTDGCLIVGQSTTGDLTIESTGTVIASGTGGASLAMSVGRTATGVGTVNVAGLLSLKNGGALIGDLGRAMLTIAPTGTMLVSGQYKQNSISTLAIDVNQSRTTPYLDVSGTATLNGILSVTGITIPSAGSYTKASDVPTSTYDTTLLMRAGAGFNGHFTLIYNPDAAASLPSYIGLSSSIVNNTDYRIGYDFIGVFDIPEGETFELDIPLIDKAPAAGWSGNSLNKYGPGTLVVTATNTYTGLTFVDGGIVQYATQGDVFLQGPIHNFGVIDLNGAATPAGFRKLTTSQLIGQGQFLMTINPAAGTSDQIIVNGNAMGSFHLLFNIPEDPFYEINPLTLVTVSDLNEAVFTGGVDIGPRNYSVEKLDNGNVVLSIDGLSLASEAILGMAAAQNMMWSGQRDNLGRRFGDLRLPGLKESRGGFWMRGFAERATVDGDNTRRKFDHDLYGLTVGADYERQSPIGTRDLVGLYVGTGMAKQDFRRVGDLGLGDGKSTMLAAGVYAARMLDNGWFGNTTLSVMRFKNEFNVFDQSYHVTTGKHDVDAYALTAEVGFRSQAANGWFVEPSVQGSFTHFTASGYQTTGSEGSIRDVSITRNGIGQARASVLFGRNFNFARDNLLQVHARLGGSYETSGRGYVTIDDVTRRPNLDGWVAEASTGLAWRMDSANQLYFDYEAAYGQGYKKPWGFSLGFRHNW